MAIYRIHGDNIVECERTLELLRKTLCTETPTVAGPIGSPLTPTFSLRPDVGTEIAHVTHFPGYGRWKTDIIDVLKGRGGKLREATDAIICRVIDGFEEPLVAIEYCGALPAGNQAWQRNGRAYSISESGIPYVYIAEIGGYELDKKRRRKAARMPNPAVPFSYLLHSIKSPSPCIPVFVRSPGASGEDTKKHAPFYGDEALIDLLRRILAGEDITPPRMALEKKALQLVQFLATSRRSKDTIPPQRWLDAYRHVSARGTLSTFLADDVPLKWKKTATINALTVTAKKLMTGTAPMARSITSTLPTCIVTAQDRKRFTHVLRTNYANLSHSFLDWCQRERDLVICWVMGFKPKGDDARPDRGLPPLCRMLFGDDTDMLTVVYGPAPTSTWITLRERPDDLMMNNGLWEAILTCSDAILVDASTLPTSQSLAYLASHWSSNKQKAPAEAFAIHPSPLEVGEHDVDTALHLLFHRIGCERVFEGMCNPPGGDWSGMSVRSEDRTTEFRWLVLPRVTAKTAKRPDHLFQLFDRFDPSLLLAIESKGLARSVETGIGPRLVRYVNQVTSTAPSVRRTDNSPWTHDTVADHVRPRRIATAAAFVASPKVDYERDGNRAQVDVVFGFEFPSTNDSCALRARPRTKIGGEICEFLKELRPEPLSLSIDVQ